MALLRTFCLLTALFFAFSLSYAQVNTELLRKDNMAPGIKNTISVDYNLSAGNSENFMIIAGLRSDYKTENLYMFLDSYMHYLESGGKMSASKGFAHYRISTYFTNWLAAEAFAQKDFNRPAKLADRNLAGAGLRLPILSAAGDSTKLSMAVGIGLMWEQEKFLKGYDKQTDLLRSTNYLNIKYLSDSFNLSVTGYYQVNTALLNDFRILSDLSLAFRISKYFSFVTGIDYRYDNQPPATVKNYDIEIKNGIKINF